MDGEEGKGGDEVGRRVLVKFGWGGGEGLG